MGRERENPGQERQRRWRGGGGQNMRGHIREALNSGVKTEDLSCSNEETWSHVEYFSQGIMGSRWHFFPQRTDFFF